MKILVTNRQRQLIDLVQSVPTLDELAELFGLDVPGTRTQVYRLIGKGILLKSNVRPEEVPCVEWQGKVCTVYCYRNHEVEIVSSKDYIEPPIIRVNGREPPLKPVAPDLIAKALASRSALERVW